MKTAGEILQPYAVYAERGSVVEFTDATEAMEEYAAQFSPKWISVKDEPMPVRTEIITYNDCLRNYSRQFIGMCFGDGSFKSAGMEVGNITHWKHLDRKP